MAFYELFSVAPSGAITYIESVGDIFTDGDLSTVDPAFDAHFCDALPEPEVYERFFTGFIKCAEGE